MRIAFNPSGRSTLGFVVSAIVNLVFFCTGLFVLGYGYMQYRNGAPPQQQLVWGGAGAGFVFMSLFLFYRTWRQRQQAEAAEDLREKHADALWKVRPAWRSAQLSEDSERSWSLILFAVLWNVFTWPLAGYIYYDVLVASSNPQWGGLFVIVFPLSGLFLGWMAVRRMLHRRKYGTATLSMETMPARLGQRLQARLQTGVRTNAAPKEGFHVQLSCYRRYVRWTTDSDGDRKKEVKKDLKWRDEKRVRGRPYGTENKLEVPISFALPTDQPSSTPEKKEERIMWHVEAEAEVPGLDFETVIEIPVFEPEGGVEASKGKEHAPAAQDADDEVFWTVGAEDDGPRHTESTEEAAADPYAQYEVGNAFTEPVSDGITMEQTASGGLRVAFDAARNQGMAVVVTVLGLACFGGGILLLGASFFGALVALGIGSIVLYGAWRQWTHSSTLTIERGQVTVQSGSFGTGSTVTFPCANLLNAKVEIGGRTGQTSLYELALYRTDAETQRKAEEGAQQVEQVAGFMKSTGLFGSGEQTDELLEQMKENAEEYGQKVKVAGGLSNKQEADWIAAKIVEAAEREASFA